MSLPPPHPFFPSLLAHLPAPAWPVLPTRPTVCASHRSSVLVLPPSPLADDHAPSSHPISTRRRSLTLPFRPIGSRRASGPVSRPLHWPSRPPGMFHDRLFVSSTSMAGYMGAFFSLFFSSFFCPSIPVVDVVYLPPP
ncbi:hypothetical protein LX36DRAFT_61363 [Colletotrichum falcatum]|nr:hypothetical protein LX36DRAFT_61363 [Colletotrichum falcatum]